MVELANQQATSYAVEEHTGSSGIDGVGERAESRDQGVLSARDGAHELVGGWWMVVHEPLSTNHQPIVLQSDFNDERQDSQAIQR